MRIFIAVNITEAERERLAAASRPLREAGYPIRWVTAENVHLTLKFLGEVSEDRVAEVCVGVDGAADGVDAFEMRVGGFGAFPNPRRPNVIWSGIEPSPTLGELQERVEAELSSIGFPREDRKFRPHLTIGRAKKKARPHEFGDLEEALAELSYADTFHGS
jgi:2'-5' RNA ligase